MHDRDLGLTRHCANLKWSQILSRQSVHPFPGCFRLMFVRNAETAYETVGQKIGGGNGKDWSTGLTNSQLGF